eukprot:gene15409-biopygen5190
MITIYLARAVGKDTPEVYQVWVADDGLFGTHPKAAPAFLTALRKRYKGLGLRLSKEKLEVFGVNCGEMPEWRITTTGGGPCGSVGLTNNTTLQRASNTVVMHTDSQQITVEKISMIQPFTLEIKTGQKTHIIGLPREPDRVETEGGIRGYIHNDDIGSPTTADIPDAIEGVIPLDNYL